VSPGPRPTADSSLAAPECAEALGRAPAAEAAAEYESALQHRLRYLVRVDQPLVLISQAGRSGGTLLLRLFDDHPECHVVPYELQRIFRGMSGDLSSAEAAWRSLVAEKQFARRRPFLLRPRLQRAIFEECAGRSTSSSPRELLDCFFTSYFNGWLDNRNLRTGPKRWVVGFEPGATKLEAHARHYPDGRVISLVRDPWSWYASRREKRAKWADIAVAIGDWSKHVSSALDLQGASPDRVRVVLLADLLARTETTMRALADWLAIDFTESLLRPSFNGLPAGGRSSFHDVGSDISVVPLKRGSALTAEESSFVADRAGGLYERATAAALPIGRA